MIWLVLAVAAVAATSLLAAAALELPSALSFGLAAFVLASAEVVGATELLSLPGVVGAAGYAVCEAVLLAVAAAAWRWRGSPRPRLAAFDVRAALRAHPVLAGLLLVVGCGIGYEAFLVFSTPPNNWDSMTYHLSRAAGWYQRHRVEYFPSHTQRQNAFQPDAEMEILYTFAFVGRDTAAAAVQLVGQLGLLLGVAGCARRLGFGRAAAAFAALLTATLSEVALQSVTTQNDLLAASFLVAAAYFALGGGRVEIALAGLALGLALGTKLTTAPALPLLVLLLATRRPVRRRLAEGAAFAAVGFLLLGAYSYVLNLAETGHVLGDPTASQSSQPSEITLGGTVSSIARIGYRFIDLSGYHVLNDAGSWVRARARDAFDTLRIPRNPRESTGTTFVFPINRYSNEDYSFFGPLGFLLLPALGVAFLVAAARRRAPPAAAVLALAVPLFLVAISLTFTYNVWIGRFFVAPVALTMPLAAAVYRWRALAAIVAVLGALTLGVTHAFNMAKPTGLDGPAVWSLSRADAQSVLRPEMEQVIEGIDQYVRPGGTVGFVLTEDDWDYPLYGAQLKNRLVRLPQTDLLQTAERRGVHWIFLDAQAVVPPLRDSWHRLDFPTSGWTMLSRSEELG